MKDYNLKQVERPEGLLKAVTKLLYWSQFSLPAVYGEELTYAKIQGIMAQKINEVIEQLNVNTEWTQYLLDEGVENETIAYINVLVENGTLANLINNELLGDWIKEFTDRQTEFENGINTNVTGFESDMTSKYNVLKAQLDNFISGATPDPDNELKDIRVEFNGTVAATAGDAVRAQMGLANKFVKEFDAADDIDALTQNGWYFCGSSNLPNNWPNDITAGMLMQLSKATLANSRAYQYIVEYGTCNMKVRCRISGEWGEWKYMGDIGDIVKEVAPTNLDNLTGGIWLVNGTIPGLPTASNYILINFNSVPFASQIVVGRTTLQSVFIRNKMSVGWGNWLPLKHHGQVGSAGLTTDFNALPDGVFIWGSSNVVTNGPGYTAGMVEVKVVSSRTIQIAYSYDGTTISYRSKNGANFTSWITVNQSIQENSYTFNFNASTNTLTIYRGDQRIIFAKQTIGSYVLWRITNFFDGPTDIQRAGVESFWSPLSVSGTGWSGGAHGNESFETINVFADGVPLNMSSNIGVTPFEKIDIYETSYLKDSTGANLALRSMHLSIDKRIKVTCTFSPVKAFTINSGYYCGMANVPDSVLNGYSEDRTNKFMPKVVGSTTEDVITPPNNITNFTFLTANSSIKLTKGEAFGPGATPTGLRLTHYENQRLKAYFSNFIGDGVTVNVGEDFGGYYWLDFDSM